MAEIVFCSFVSLTEVALFVKVLNMRYRTHVFQQHLNDLHNFKLENGAEMALIHGRLRILTKMLFAYIGLVMVTGAMSYSVPFFVDETILPYLAWYPIDWYHNSKIYWFLYAYQVAGMIIQSHTLVCMEMYMVYIFVLLSTQLDIINERLRANGWQNVDDNLNTNDLIRIKTATSTALVKCISAHRTVAG